MGKVKENFVLEKEIILTVSIPYGKGKEKQSEIIRRKPLGINSLWER